MMTKPLGGLRARGRKKSKVLECSARFFCEREEEWFDVKTIYRNMTFKNGKLYKNYRYAKSMGTLESHMDLHKGFKKKLNPVNGRTESTWLYSFDKSLYEHYFPTDPQRNRGEDRIYRGPQTNAYKNNRGSE